MISASGISSNPLSKEEKDEKKLQRSIRFGMPNNTEEEEKKRKRAERFGQTLDNIPGSRVIKRIKQ